MIYDTSYADNLPQNLPVSRRLFLTYQLNTFSLLSLEMEICYFDLIELLKFIFLDLSNVDSTLEF